MHTDNSDQTMLIASMQKLVQYVGTSRQHQWQIFEALSKKDIQKVINNFSNQNNKLRKLSLTFLGIILNSNNSLKQRFCQRLQINLIPGKICLNFSINFKIQLQPQKIKQLLQLLKQPIQLSDNHFPIWIISLRKYPFKIDFIPLNTLNYIDPIDNLVGFTLIKNQKENPKKEFLNIFQTAATKPVQINNRTAIFKANPSTTRNSSPATQNSYRFTRTNNNKASLKSSLKGSMVQNRPQSQINEPFFGKPKYISQNKMIQSLTSSPRKQYINSHNVLNKNSINDFSDKDTIKVNPINNSSQQTQSNRSVVNNTHIYINVPFNSISINYKETQKLNMHKQGFINNYIYPQTCKNINDNKYVYNHSVNPVYEISKNPIQINNSRPMFKKYERITTKRSGEQYKQIKSFNFDQYRKFVHNSNNSIK